MLFLRITIGVVISHGKNRLHAKGAACAAFPFILHIAILPQLKRLVKPVFQA